jgi:hypothetical protein
MRHNRGAWLAAGITGLLVAGAATAGIASASSTATRAPAAVKHWNIIFKAPKIKPADQPTQQFTAVVATGKTTGFAFDGTAAPGGETAWERTGGTWRQVPFPGKKNTEYVGVAAASSPSNVWAFANDFSFDASRVLRWTGTKFAVVKTFNGNIWGASVLGPKDVWAFGMLPSGFSAPAIGVWHYNGQTWTRVGKNISGGSALNDHDVWGFTAASVEHWNGHTWAATSVKSLLPKPQPLNDPMLVGVLALSDTNVYAIGSANSQDEGGPVVVLHFNGHTWGKVATGQFGYGPDHQQFSSDGSGGLWLPMDGPAGGTGLLVHYAGGKLTTAAVPVNPATLTVDSISLIPGTTQALAGGFTHAANQRSAKVVAVLLQSS